MNEIEEKRRARVAKRDAYDAGECQGCRDRHKEVYEINAGNWITRFCWDCLQDIVAQARRQK